MRSNLAIVHTEDADDFIFEKHATDIRGILNKMQHDTDFHKTHRAYDRIVSLFATLASGECCLTPPQTVWGRVIWNNLFAMADLKSHAAALEEARRIREQLVAWHELLRA